MLGYYKTPFAVNCSKSFMVVLRQALEDHLSKLKQGSRSTLKQANALNLIKLFQANLDCMKACRIDLKEILPDSEFNLIGILKSRQLADIKPLPSQVNKADADLTPEEIIQIHLVEAAQELNKTLSILLDKESRTSKLASLDKYIGAAILNEEGAEAKIIMRFMPILASKKNVKDLLQGDAADFAVLKRVIGQFIKYLKDKVVQAVADSLKSKTFVHREVGLTHEIRLFTKLFCQELMAEFGN